MLEPILLEPDAAEFEVLAVAALWALSSDRHERLLPCLHEGSEGSFRALARAVALHPDVTTDRWVRGLLSEVAAFPPMTRARIWTLVGQRPAPDVTPSDALFAALCSDDASELEAAAALLRWASKEHYAHPASEIGCCLGSTLPRSGRVGWLPNRSH